MEKALLTICDFILSSNRKLTSTKVNYTTEERKIISDILNTFFIKFPIYKDTIGLKNVYYEIKEGNKKRNNPDHVNYLLIFDKRYIQEKENKVFGLILRKCNILKKKDELVDIVETKVSNLDELELIVSDFYKENPCEEEFSIRAEKDKSQYYISIMNMEKYSKDMKKFTPTI